MIAYNRIITSRKVGCLLYNYIQLPVSPMLTMKAEVHNANLRSVCRANRGLSSRSILSLLSCYNLCVYVRLLAVYRVHIPIERLFPH